MTIGSKLFTRLGRCNSRYYFNNITRRACTTSPLKSIYSSVLCKQETPSFSKHFVNLSVRYSGVRAMDALSPRDPSSFSRPELVIVKHVSLSIDVDFEKEVLNGVAVLNFDVLDDINSVALDTSDLLIETIETEDGSPLDFDVGLPVLNFGAELTINLPKKTTKGDKIGAKNLLDDEDQVTRKEVASTCDGLELIYNGYIYKPNLKIQEIKGDTSQIKNVSECCSQYYKNGMKIKIKYKTSPAASALQWLKPNQTSGKKHPYLFSQCQPIHARSILPCQDTPAVKFTYDAEVTAPEEFTILMSALRDENRTNTTTKFRQPVPIPSYLLAIAVGVLEHRTLGPRSRVWSEKEEVERSAWEFAETEKYLQAAEKLCGPYVWSQYDLLVLPPSFPYGGMENPCLTFVTPTLLAGDRSQADVIVHEIMHSWTGNLVTNRNFEHFWLNEGFTVFLERKVAASLVPDAAEAKRSRDFHSLLGLQELSETVNEHFGATNPLTRLVPDLKSVHPDDAFSRVPYEKGSLFLRYLEDLVGGPEVFDNFLRAYLNNFKEKSLDTNQFKSFLLNYFKDNEQIKKVDWDTWLFTAGMPPIIPAYDTSMTKSVTALLTAIDEGNASLTYDDVKTFTPHQMINLLQELIDRSSLPLDKLRTIGKEYKIDSSSNSEIVYRWLRLCIRSRDFDRVPDVFKFVNNQGRMKYVRPVYRDLYAWEEVRDRAIANFLENETYMMHVSAYTLRKDLHLSTQSVLD